MSKDTDTIYAPSTPVGGAIAVIRVSGAEAKRAAALFDRDILDKPGMLRFCRVLSENEVVDECMAVYFSAPKSYTGEDMLEINCHGGPMTVQRLLALLCALGFRPAAGGEFTRRAFENGKMDLSQAEAVMDVVTAEAEAGLKSAVLQLTGSVGEKVHILEQLLLDALSGIDAAIDYPDEAEADTLLSLSESLCSARAELQRLIEEGRAGRVLRDGLRVAIIGRPNVGKSSLLNALLGRDRAIVTEIPGTTRDVLEERIQLFGVPVRLIDTAGVRQANDEAERIGVQRTQNEREAADLVLLLLDGSAPLQADDLRLLSETEPEKRLVAVNKCDLPACVWQERVSVLSISARTGEGLDALRQAICAFASPGRADAAAITNERHIHALERALDAVADAENAQELDCAATDIRDALKYLGSITGTDVDETVIDRIFERFCVGK